MNYDLSSARAIRLVAKREIRARLLSKAFVVITAITLLLIVAGSFVAKAINGEDVQIVGVTLSASAAINAVESAASATGKTIDVRPISESTGRDAVESGDLDALITSAGPPMRVVVKEELSSDLSPVLSIVSGRVALDDEISKLGGDPAIVQQELAKASLSTEALHPPRERNGSAITLGFIAGILIYISLISQGSAIAQGVVEEKSSRVVEILLATVKPWQLLAGKVLGVGIVGLIQIALISIVGALVATSTGALDISIGDALGTVVWLIVWYILGYFLYAFVLAAVASLVSRQEDVGSVMTPVLMLLIIGYVYGVSVLPSDPDNQVAAILSVIPVFSPTLMPMRIGMGGVPIWQEGLAVFLTVATLPLLVAVGGRIYRNAVVRTGARVSLRSAFRRA